MVSIKERLSLSSCWCSARHTDGYAMISEIRELGFRRTELSHGIRMALVPGILKALEEDLIEVSSVHNFCPLPASVNHAAPNLFQPSAANAAELTAWHRYSRQSIEFAARIGAPHVVMHSGSVQIRFRSPRETLEDVDADLADREAAWYKLVRASAKRLPAVIEEYRKLIDFAEEHQVTMGAENREAVLELPLDTEFLKLLKPFDDEPRLRYWHDTGHAEIKHLLGFIDHEEHLEKMSSRLIGFHLHDVTDGKDHQVPGSGSVDFNMIKHYVRPEHTLVLEPSPKLTSEEIAYSRDYLIDALS